MEPDNSTLLNILSQAKDMQPSFKGLGPEKIDPNSSGFKEFLLKAILMGPMVLGPGKGGAQLSRNNNIKSMPSPEFIRAPLSPKIDPAARTFIDQAVKNNKVPMSFPDNANYK